MRFYKGSAQTIIGHDVWIGVGAYIGAGVSVGHGCVVGAKAVVTKNTPPYSVVVGNPARIVKLRFSPSEIERLLRLEWWNWPDEKVRSSIEWFYRPISDFLDHFEVGCEEPR